MNGYAREPALNADTYKRMVQTWLEHSARQDMPKIMTFTVPRQYLEAIKSYCKEHQVSYRLDGARDYRYTKLTVYKPITTGAN